MKTLKAQPTVVVTGIFKKRYYLILPDLGSYGVFELPVYDFERLKKQQEEDSKNENTQGN